jgi:hypothetical protein
MRFWRADPGEPPGSGADSVFVGATRYTGPLTWLRLLPRWNRMVAQMRRLPGYRAHGVYYEPPWTLGTVGFFATQDDLMTFARTGEHRELMTWVVGDDRRQATGGYIRVYRAADPPARGHVAAPHEEAADAHR